MKILPCAKSKSKQPKPVGGSRWRPRAYREIRQSAISFRTQNQTAVTDSHSCSTSPAAVRPKPNARWMLDPATQFPAWTMPPALQLVSPGPALPPPARRQPVFYSRSVRSHPAADKSPPRPSRKPGGSPVNYAPGHFAPSARDNRRIAPARPTHTGNCAAKCRSTSISGSAGGTRRSGPNSWSWRSSQTESRWPAAAAAVLPAAGQFANVPMSRSFAVDRPGCGAASQSAPHKTAPHRSGLPRSPREIRNTNAVPHFSRGNDPAVLLPGNAVTIPELAMLC